MPLKECLKMKKSKFSFIDFLAFISTMIFLTNVNINLTNVLHLIALGCIGVFLYTVIKRLLYHN